MHTDNLRGSCVFGKIFICTINHTVDASGTMLTNPNVNLGIAFKGLLADLDILTLANSAMTVIQIIILNGFLNVGNTLYF